MESEVIDVPPAAREKVAAEQQATLMEISKNPEMQLMREQAKIMIQSQILPKHLDTPQKVYVVWLYGKALGLEMAQAVQDIYVVNGMACMSAKLMKALVHKKMPKAIFRVKSSSDKECVMEAAREPSDPIVEYTFTREKADKAGITTKPEYVNNRRTGKLVEKDNWKNWPEEMLLWRNISRICRLVFPDCFLGVGAYSPEEFSDDTDMNGLPLKMEIKERTSKTLNNFNKKYSTRGKELTHGRSA